MLDVPVLYKNILMIILTILLFFILSIDSNWNEFLHRKKSIKFIIIFIIIYLNYYNINLSLLCLPLFAFIMMKHPNFKSRVIHNPKLSYFKEHLQSFYSEFFNDYSSPIVSEIKQPEIKQPEIKHLEIKQPEIKQPEIKHLEIKQPENITIMDEDDIYKSTTIEALEEINENENENKTLTIDEMKELYENLKFELTEIDKKYEH